MREDVKELLAIILCLGVGALMIFALTQCGKDETERIYCPPKAPTGQNQKIKLGESAMLGEGGQSVGVKYLWMPMDDFMNPTELRATVMPKKTTVYLLKATSNCGMNFNTVRITVE